MSSKSRHPLSERDIQWTDLILVMEDKHQQRIRETFRGCDLPPIASLDIPDDYAFMDPELIVLIRECTEPFLEDLLGAT